MATNVVHVDNFEADYFYNHIVAPATANINDLVVNQSFIFGYATTDNSPPAGYITVGTQQSLDSTIR